MYRMLRLAFLAVLISAVAIADVIRDGTLRAESQTAGVFVQWVSDNETNIASYMVERTVTGSADAFVVIQRIPAKGSGAQYSFLDYTAFKTTDSFYRYRVTPLDVSGNAGGPAKYTQLIRSSVSSVRRTWGSIKAMFR